MFISQKFTPHSSDSRYYSVIVVLRNTATVSTNASAMIFFHGRDPLDFWSNLLILIQHYFVVALKSIY